jgi:hypothetical protein
VVGQLEAALAPLDGARERPSLVPEDLALEQRLGNRRAVDRHIRRARPRTELVDRLRHQLLAGSRFAADEDRGVGRCRLLDRAVDLPHPGAVADEPPEAAVLAQLAAQHLHLAQRLLPLHDLVEQDPQPLRIDRLGQVVVGAGLDGLDGGLDGPLRGEDDQRHVRVLVLQRVQQLQAVHARHHEVRDDDRRAERRHLLERLLAVRRAVGVKAPRPHQLGQPHTGGRIVLDH